MAHVDEALGSPKPERTCLISVAVSKEAGAERWRRNKFLIALLGTVSQAMRVEWRGHFSEIERGVQQAVYQ